MHSKLYRRILNAFLVSVTLIILILVITISQASYKNAMERYEHEALATIDVFKQNMDHYISNCVAAARAVYSDSGLLALMTKQRDTLPNQEERALILQYLKTVHYACPSAIQIYLACPNLHQSYLYDPSVLMMTYGAISTDDEQVPVFSSYLDVNVEPTHQIVHHGHKTLYFDQRQDRQVLTLWLPIYDLPRNTTQIASVAIDLPTDFLLNNSRLTIDSQEQIFITAQDNRIIAASDEAWIRQNMDSLLTREVMDRLEERRFNLSDGMLVSAYDVELQYCAWKVYRMIPVGRILDKTWNMFFLFMVLFIVLLALLFLVNTQHIRRQLKPLQRITGYMKQVARSQSAAELGSLSDYMHYDGHDELQELIGTFDWMMKALENYRIKQYELELAYDRSTFRMLQAQINPHFIYNILQCFATHALRRQDMEQYRMLSSFGQMMHYAMVLNPYMVSLRQEIEYVERYVDLQRMRFSSQDQVKWHAGPEVLRLSVPKMCLQPLVENSIVHGGLFQKPGSRLEIFAECSGDWLCISVRDNGVAISDEKKEMLMQKLEQLRMRLASRDMSEETSYFREASAGLGEDRQSSVIGIANVYNRLLLLFSDVSIAFYANDWGGTTVDLKLCLTSMKGDRRDDRIDCR